MQRCSITVFSRMGLGADVGEEEEGVGVGGRMAEWVELKGVWWWWWWWEIRGRRNCFLLP